MESQGSNAALSEEIECPICFNSVTDAYMCPGCKKVLCKGCWSDTLAKKPECPMCRLQLQENQLIRNNFMNEMRMVS